MRRMLLVAVLAVFWTGTASAEIDTDAGSRSVLFSFSGLSELGAGSYDLGTTPSLPSGGEGTRLTTAGIGFRKFLANGLAIRPGLTLGFASNKTEFDNREVTESGSAFGLSAVLEKHYHQPGARIAPYLGVGAGLGVASGSAKVDFKDGAFEDREDKSSGFGLGVFGALGFQAEVFDGANLGAEYRLGLAFNSGSIEPDGSDKIDTSSFGMGISTASFFLSVDLD